MKDSASGSVKVSYYSKCLGTERRQTNKCDGLKVGDVVEFETEIVALSCPADAKDRIQEFTIYPVGVGENVTVRLEMICSCDCESSGATFQLNSRICNGVGTLSCGICDCADGFFGRNCECNGDSVSSLDDSKCRNGTDGLECSGRGTCVW